jgi:hypothetical protein
MFKYVLSISAAVLALNVGISSASDPFANNNNDMTVVARKQSSASLTEDANCIALLRNYIHEWKSLAAMCEQSFGKVEALQGRIIENKRILEYIRENSASFPKNRASHMAVVDGLTQQGVNGVSLASFVGASTTEDMLTNWGQGLQEVSSRLAPVREELSNPLTTGVEAFKKILKEENMRLAQEIGPHVLEYKRYAQGIQLIADELGNASVRDQMAKALMILSEQIDEAESQISSIEGSKEYKETIREIHENLRWLKDRVDNRRSGSPMLQVFYAAFDQPWHHFFKRYDLFKDEVTKMFDREAGLETEGGKCISELFRFYDHPEVVEYLESLEGDSNAPVMLESMKLSLEKLAQWRLWHLGANAARSVRAEKAEQREFVETMWALATSPTEDPSFLVKKAAQKSDAIDCVIANHTREQLWKAYEDLKSENRTQAILQVVRNLVEEKVTGFGGDNFTRWILVTFVMPNLVPSAQQLLDALVVKIAEKLGVDASKPIEQVIMMRDSQADNKVVREFTPHFPGVPELQRTRGMLGEDLIQIIQHLPVAFFADLMRSKVESILADRDTFVKEKGADIGQAIVTQVSKLVQGILVEAVRQHFAAPSLMKISDPKLEDLLKARVGAEDSDSISALNSLRLHEQSLVNDITLFGSDKISKGAELVEQIDSKVQKAAQAIRTVERVRFGFQLLGELNSYLLDPAYACTQLFAAARAGVNRAIDFMVDDSDIEMVESAEVAAVPAQPVEASEIRARFLELIHAQDQFKQTLNSNFRQ